MGYFRSKAFVVSGLIGLVLASTTAFGPVLFPELVGSFATEPCDTPDGISVAPTQAQDASGQQNLDFQSAPGEALHICIVAGFVKILPHDGSDVEFEVTIVAPVGDVHGLEEQTQVVLHRDGSTLVLAETAHGRSSHWVGTDEAQVEVVVRVPASLAQSYDVQLDQGTLTATGLAGVGQQNWHVGVGDADLRFASLQAAQIDASVQVGDLQVRIPNGPAYTIDAHVQVGAIDLAVQGFDLDDRNTDVPGERIQGHTEGDVPVTLLANVQVGDIRLWTA